MPTVIKAAILVVLALSLAFALYSLAVLLSPPEIPPWETASPASDPAELETIPSRRDYSLITRLFPAKTSAVSSGLAAEPTAAQVTPIVPTAPGRLDLRYIGTIITSGKPLYYIRDETKSRLIRIGEGSPFQELEFVEEKNGIIYLLVEGVEYELRK
ncbi:MAG: hypothetical protein KKI09_02810 [Spirochaetes bacterium]|nr:hypothetical protein [Spirochaetota bacterium]MBU0954335.1 hypothetical protein [Spirochaetota bacterium]